MIIHWIKNKLLCLIKGHKWHYEKAGRNYADYIRCGRCWKLDEYVPGEHEPKGYDYDGVHFNWRERIG